LTITSVPPAMNFALSPRLTRREMASSMVEGIRYSNLLTVLLLLKMI
jgi:hypothetical protein